MKYLFFILLVFIQTTAFSQQYALATRPATLEGKVMEYRPLADSTDEKSTTHIHGSRGLITGVAMLGSGTAIVLTLGLLAPGRTELTPFYVAGGWLASAGVITTVLSGIVYLANKPSYSSQHYYSVYRHEEKVGIAYNF